MDWSRFFKKIMGIRVKVAFILIMSILISGCNVLYDQKEIEGYKVDTSELLAKGYVFDRIEIRRGFETNQVFFIENEQELALLVIKNLENDITRTHYVTDHSISLQHVYLFAETLLHDSFYIQAGKMVYSDPLRQHQTYTYFVEVVLDDTTYDASFIYADNIIESLDLDGKSDREKVKAIHDHIILTTAYDEPLLELDITEYQNHPSFTPYGVYHFNKAVCSGYARAFMQLSRMVGIPAIMVSSQNMNHAWNMVYVDDEWLFLDVTWNDPIPDKQGRVLYTYYLKTLEQFDEIGHHYFDLASEKTLSIDEVFEFANYAFAVSD